MRFCQTAHFSFQEQNSSAASRQVEAKGNRSEGSRIMGNSEDFRRFRPGTKDERDVVSLGGMKTN